MNGAAHAALAAVLLAAPASADPLRIAVISDMNGSYGSTEYGREVVAAVDAILARRPDLVISTGDMIAGQRPDPKLGPDELASMWAAFHATVSDRLSAAGIPFLVTPGNHDASAYPGYEAERRAFAAAWADRLPAIAVTDATDWPFRIAAALDGVRIVGMDATRSGPLDQQEMAWLRDRLAPQGRGGETVILFGHLPLMPASQGREDDILGDPALLTLAQEAGVDLWLSGHQHAFYSGTTGGILFVAQGALGDGPRRLIGTADRSPATLTWIDVAEDGAINVTALLPPEFTAEMPQESLPPTLGSGPFRLTRAFGKP